MILLLCKAIRDSQCIYLCDSLLGRIRKVSKDVEDVVSKLYHGSNTRVVAGELDLS